MVESLTFEVGISGTLSMLNRRMTKNVANKERAKDFVQQEMPPLTE